MSDVCSVLGLSRDGDVRAVVLLASEDHLTVDQCIERVVLTDTYACTWVMLRATLADDDVTSLSVLTTEELYSESRCLLLGWGVWGNYTIFLFGFCFC